MNILSAIILITLGLSGLFAKDWWWRQTESRHRAAGLVSERTPEWDKSETQGSIGLIVLGILILLLSGL